MGKVLENPYIAALPIGSRGIAMSYLHHSVSKSSVWLTLWLRAISVSVSPMSPLHRLAYGTGVTFGLSIGPSSAGGPYRTVLILAKSRPQTNPVGLPMILSDPRPNSQTIECTRFNRHGHRERARVILLHAAIG